MADRSLLLRTQEIIANSPTPISAIDAAKTAILERFKDLDTLASAYASDLAQSSKALRKMTYNLAESNQIGLFDIPPIIAIDTPDGPLFIPKDLASKGQAHQWTREARQHLSTQLLRFDRLGADFEIIADIDDDVLWTDARKTLAERKKKELEAGE